MSKKKTVSEKKPVKGWWFSREPDKLNLNGKAPVSPGQTLVHQGELVLCESGLHASKNPRDALTYAPGHYLWRVEGYGEVVEGDDKFVATHRKHLWRVDAEELLVRFARMCASDVLGDWDGEVPEVVRLWLKTGDEKYREGARSAADSAADSAYWSGHQAADAASRAVCWAANSVADSAADSAYWAANSAANKAAGSAYWAAYSAADSAARKSQAERLTSMIFAQAKKEGLV